MVIKQGNIWIYDNFKIGTVDLPAPPGADRYIHVSFTEQDFPQETDFMNTAHIFKIHEEQLDPFIELLRERQGKKVHIAREMPHGSG